jgi:hypothetical protein
MATDELPVANNNDMSHLLVPGENIGPNMDEEPASF